MRRDRQRLNDILEALDWIAKAIADKSEADFLADETLCYAVAQELKYHWGSGGATQSRSHVTACLGSVARYCGTAKHSGA
jgi:hypothetical protein